MEDLLTLILIAGFFFLMMRYGCGSHMMHGHSKKGKESSDFVDPVCGMKVEKNQGYVKNFNDTAYHFCSRECLDKFDKSPEQYITESSNKS